MTASADHEARALEHLQRADESPSMGVARRHLAAANVELLLAILHKDDKPAPAPAPKSPRSSK